MNRRVVVAVLTAAFIFALGVTAGLATSVILPPSGQPVLNQARQGLALTKSNSTILTTTRGIHIGDATACNITVRFVGDDSSTVVAIDNVQPGSDHPYSIIQLRSTGTTCADVVGLY